ncbi:MAG: hypothetical protein IAF38_17195 [Bacteroidia bacterium]|nr:hypothetical protein [Bacteroidia bacterium]
MIFRKNTVIALNLTAVLLLALTACIKKQDFPTSPEISYKNFTNYDDDSAYFTIKFTDGDGDFGLKPEDTSGSFTSTGKYYFNMYMKYMYKKTDGTWSAYFNANPMVNDTQYYKFRIPFIEQTGKDKSMNGEIRVKLTELRPTTTHKFIKYVVYIYDKSLHQSNVVTTPEFPLP